jgi:hypothetical protein
MLNDKTYLTKEGINKIISIKASTNNGLSAELAESFPNIIPVKRPEVKLSKIPDFNWLVGFTEGDGCFDVKITKNIKYNLAYQTQLRFRIAQHVRDKSL